MKQRVPQEMIMAALATLGVMAGTVTGAQGATHVALTRDAKGILNPHPIAVDEHLGRVFIANPSHSARSVSVLAARSGRLLYTVPVRMFPIATAVDEQNQRVFVAGSVSDVTQPGSVSVLDARSGRIVRTVQVGRNPVAVVIDAPANRAFVIDAGDEATASTGSVSILDATSGKPLGRIDATNPQAGAVDEQTGRVFIADAALVLLCDASTGRVQQTILTPGTPLAVAVDARTHHVFVTTSRGTVLMLDARTGAVLRTLAFGENMSLAGAAVEPTTNHVFVTGFDTRSYAGQVYVLDARSGTRLRRVAVGPNPAAVAVAAGRVLVVQSGFRNGTVSGYGFLSILDARSGRVLRTVDVPDPWGMAVDRRVGVAYITDENNAVSVVDLQSGAVVRTLPAPYSGAVVPTLPAP